MAALVQGIQYGLSSQRNIIEENDLIFVKLTDSACRAIEEYQRNKSKTSDCPTIQFLGNEGRILIPTASAHGYARFDFGLSTNADIEGLQGSFECIKHASARGSSIQSLGAMHCKMRIHAKEDIYEATRNRVAIIEENSKKNCTREIKPGGPGIGKKVKLGANRVSHLATSKRDNSPTKPYSKPSSNNYAPAIPRNGIVQANYVSSAHTKPQGNNHAQKPGNPDVIRRPLRERLIHLLALRPYKKPELYDRIIKDGCRERDKNQITNVLKMIAFLRDNTYHLQRHVWNDVQEEWPFYSEQEKQVLKRRKPQNLTPPGSSDCGSSGSGQSPTSTHPGSPPSSVVCGKRPGYFDGADGLETKRQRVSHYRKPSPKKPDSEEESEPVAPRWGQPAPVEPPPEEPPVQPAPDFPEYRTSYTTICSEEQRARYKADFNADYALYRGLHSVVEGVSRRFAQLEARLRDEKKDSPGFKSVKEQIVKEYQANKDDQEYQTAKLRFQYLHEKLSHIKRLVVEFDGSRY